MVAVQDDSLLIVFNQRTCSLSQKLLDDFSKLLTHYLFFDVQDLACLAIVEHQTPGFVGRHICAHLHNNRHNRNYNGRNCLDKLLGKSQEA